MLSLKYKNIIKKALYEEEESPEELKKRVDNNYSVYRKVINEIDKNYSINSLWWIDETENSSTIYVIDNPNQNKNSSYELNIYNFTYDYKKTSISCNIENKIVNNIDFDQKPVSQNAVLKYLYQLFSQFQTSLKGRKSKFEKNNVDVNKDIQSFKDLKDVQAIEDIKARLDTLEIYNKKEEPVNTVNSNIETKVKNSIEYQFKPSKIIKDDAFRTIKGVKETVEESILDFEKRQSEINKDKPIQPQEIAAAIVYEALQAAVSNNPQQIINITKDSLKRNKKLPDNFFQREDIDFNKIVDKKKTKAKEGEFEKGSLGSSVLKMVSVDPPEIFSPIVFANMSIPFTNWSVDENGISSKVMIDYLFNRYDSNALKKADIRYFPTINEPLVDSQIRVQVKTGKFAYIGVSTKGGMNGEGAQASIASIFQFMVDNYPAGKMHPFSRELFPVNESNHPLYNTRKQLDGIIDSFINTHCTSFKNSVNGKRMLRDYKEEISLIILFGGVKPSYHQDIMNIIFDNEAEKKKEKKIKFVNQINQLNESTNISKCIMEFLSIQKYDFAQVNCTPYFTGDTVKYEYHVQYPAKFVGVAKLEQRNGGVAFHIMGA